MNKAELSRSMAKLFDKEEIEYLRLANGFTSSWTTALYSPEGFFAVWNKFDGLKWKYDQKQPVAVNAFHKECSLAQKQAVWDVVIANIYKHGGDRFTAFYTAIHEFMEKIRY